MSRIYWRILTAPLACVLVLVGVVVLLVQWWDWKIWHIAWPRRLFDKTLEVWFPPVTS